MGNTKSIFDAETVRGISIGGFGRISPNRQNQKTAHCRQCERMIEAGAGYAFRAERFGRLRSGYLCQTCVGEILQSIHSWFFNKHFELLYPVIFDSGRATDGVELAETWNQGGLNALFERVTSVEA